MEEEEDEGIIGMPVGGVRWPGEGEGAMAADVFDGGNDGGRGAGGSDEGVELGEGCGDRIGDG